MSVRLSICPSVRHSETYKNVSVDIRDTNEDVKYPPRSNLEAQVNKKQVFALPGCRNEMKG